MNMVTMIPYTVPKCEFPFADVSGHPLTRECASDWYQVALVLVIQGPRNLLRRSNGGELSAWKRTAYDLH